MGNAPIVEFFQMCFGAEAYRSARVAEIVYRKLTIGKNSMSLTPECPHCHVPLQLNRLKRHIKFCKLAPRPRGREQLTLLCAFCRAPYQDFAALANHTRNECINNPNRKESPRNQSTDSLGWFLSESPYERKDDMNVGTFVNESGSNFLPLLDPKLFRKLAKKGIVTGKMLACRQVNRPTFKGLAMDFKSGQIKFSFLARFDRWDITALAKQLGSEETDDWIGGNVRFVAKKSSKGQTFVNVELPKRKGKK